MIGILIAITTCAVVLCVTSIQPSRSFLVLFGLTDSLLWLVAGFVAGKLAVILVAAFCALCFLRPLLRGPLARLLGRKHAA